VGQFSLLSAGSGLLAEKIPPLASVPELGSSAEDGSLSQWKPVNGGGSAD